MFLISNVAVFQDSKTKKSENVTPKGSKFISLSVYNFQAIALFILINHQKLEIKIDRNIQSILHLDQQITLYMYTSLSHVLGSGKMSFYVHFNTIINSRLFKTVKHKE